jgi:hypothetical protein
MNLYLKLIEVRKEVPRLGKDTVGYNYSYVSGAKVLGSIMSKMNELGLLLVPAVLESEVIEGKKPTVKANMTMTWINAEKPDEQLVVPFACFGTQDDISKAFGSALTYSERYFLLKFFNIATDEDDPDTQQEEVKPTRHEEPSAPRETSSRRTRRGRSNEDTSKTHEDAPGETISEDKITDKQLKIIHALGDKIEWGTKAPYKSYEDFLQTDLEVNSSLELSKERASTCVELLESLATQFPKEVKL